MNLKTKYIFLPFIIILLLSCSKGSSLLEKEAPPFKLNLLEGGQIAISELRGKPVILYFFASWWWRCKDEIPLVKGAYKKYSDQGLNVIGIGIQDKKEKVAAYVKEKKLKWPVGFDDDDVIARTYGITFGAGVIFINSRGIVKGRFLGGFGKEELEREIAKIIE